MPLDVWAYVGEGCRLSFGAGDYECVRLGCIGPAEEAVVINDCRSWSGAKLG